MVNRLRNILLLLLIALSPQVSAQFDISIRVFAPQPNQLSPHDAWNFEVANNIQSSALVANINIVATIEKIGYGDIFEGKTDIFIAPQGISSYNYNLAKLRKISVLREDQGMKDFYVRYKNLPDGNYRICAELTLYDPAGNVLLKSTDCIFHTISHSGMILLNYPINGDTVPSSFFQFTWTHSTAIFSDFTTEYQLIVAEVFAHQNPDEALMGNPKLIVQDAIKNPYFDYPNFERSLDTGKTYSWQIRAYSNVRSTSEYDNGMIAYPKNSSGNRLILAESNIEHFTIGEQVRTKKEQPPGRDTATYYIMLDRSNPTTGLTYIKNSVAVSINNPFGDRNLSCTVWNERNIQIGRPKLIPVARGKNKLEIDLSDLNLASKRYYTMKLKLSESESYLLQLYKR